MKLPGQVLVASDAGLPKRVSPDSVTSRPEAECVAVREGRILGAGGWTQQAPGGKPFKVELVLIDDPVAMRDAYATGNVHIGWATLDAGETQIPANVTFDGGNSLFCDSETDRQTLIDSFGWIITGEAASTMSDFRSRI